MSDVNKHGLKRYIPEDVRRHVRVRDGFGCVICATPIVDYEHVDPEFVDAHRHDADAITLLCPTCHRKVTGKEISKDLVKKAMRSPAAKQRGTIGDTLYFCDSHPTVIFGGATFVHCEIPLQLLGEDVISITEEDGKYFLNAKFWDSQGKQTLSIIKNEWVVSSENVWDFVKVANRFHIQEHAKEPAMIIEVRDNSTLIVQRFNMFVQGRYKVIGDESTLKINGHHFSAFGSHYCKYGIVFAKE